MRVLIITAMALAFGSNVAAKPVSAKPVSAKSETLAEFADRFDQAQLRKDGAALDRMVADDLVFITGDGRRLGKKEFIAGWTAADDKFDPIALVDRVVRPLGADAGIVGAETVLSGTSAGKRFSSHFRYTDIFKRIGGEWRATYIQVTRVQK